MRWLRKEHDEGGGHYWESSIPGIGEMCVDSIVDGSEWIASAFWFGNDVEISRHPTDEAAKVAAVAWLRLKAVAIENALACGFEPVDEE